MKKSSILAILGLSGFVVMADNWVISPILPSIAAGIGVDPTEFAAASRGMAMSLMAFAFTGGGGIGTALGGRLVNRAGSSLLYGDYALALAVMVILAFFMVRDARVAQESAMATGTK